MRNFISGPARWVVLAAAVVVALIAPLYLTAFWLQLLFSISAIAVGAIGLTLLTGTAGQLSLANPFFMVMGALTYVVMSSPVDETGKLIGFGLPPIVGMISGVAVAGITGLIFSPIASRLSGIYLGMASLGLVFLSLHILNNVTPVTGGYNGRRTPNFEIFGIVFGRSENPIVIGGVPFGRLEWLWYLGIICVVLGYIFAKNILRSRPGRALRLIAAGDLPASVAGVHVAGYKARIFFVSSLYAGLSGVLFALSIGSIAPQTFDLALALQFLAMIVIGGLGSVGGAVAGAAFVMSLPILLQSALSNIPLFSGGALTTAYLSKYVYGAAIILVLLFKPSGLAGMWDSLITRLARRKNSSSNTAVPPHQRK